MGASPFDSALQRGHLGDAELAPLFTDAAEIRAMLLVEGALATVQGRLGVIPAESAAFIAAAAREVVIDPAALAPGMAADGVVVPALVTAFRTAMQAPLHAPFVHWGATSQDIADTALVLRLRRAVGILGARLDALVDRLAAQAVAQRDTVMAARTRGQIATPTTLGAKIAVWTAPLLRHQDRLAELRPRLEVVSFAGASGTLAASGAQGIATLEGLGAELGLGVTDIPWHAARDGLAELAGWLALVTGSLGKIGLDLMQLSQSELGEVRAGIAGGSSTMPHKANPVGAEVLVTLARLTARLNGIMTDALLHAQDRDGTAWALEGHALPQLCLATGAALRHALVLADTLAPDPARMAATMAGADGMMAEAAVFALAAHMPRPEAQALVKAAAGQARVDGQSFAQTLRTVTQAPVDWDATLDPAAYTGAAGIFVDRLAARVRARAR